MQKENENKSLKPIKVDAIKAVNGRLAFQTVLSYGFIWGKITVSKKSARSVA